MQVVWHTAVGVADVGAQLEAGRSLGDVAARAERRLSAVRLPAGVRTQLGGAETQRRGSYEQLAFALVLAVLLVYMVMASLFESLVHPFTILLTLPTAACGVVAALRLSETAFSVPALIGVVMLAGIAVNNGILLVVAVQERRARIGPKGPQEPLARGAPEEKRRDPDQRRPEVGVGEPVQERVAADHAHDGLDVHERLAEAEHQDAEAGAGNALDGEGRTHVQGRDGHGAILPRGRKAAAPRC